MNFCSKDYLPDSKERVEHLRKIVNGRPVAILAAGPSINELEKRIGELCHADVCYFGFSSFLQEKHILQQINKHLSVYMHLPHTMKYTIDFLNRDEDNMFASDSIFAELMEEDDIDLGKFVNKYDEKLIFFHIVSDRTVPDNNRPLHFNRTNSLLVMVQLAIIGKASRIILFGADGYCDESIEEYYYRSSEYGIAPHEHLVRDTNDFNSLATIAIRNICITYDLAPIEILNCSEKSFYTPFPKVSYDSALQYFLEGRKFDRKSDLRVPKVSVISPVANREDFLKETVENISRQSYSNYEHIIVYSEEDEEICNTTTEFPDAKWILERSRNALQMFRKGISISKGDYIFYCPNAEGHLNQDWFNTCLEIMEKDPDISLVWGLSQLINEDGSYGQIANKDFINNPPSQGKYFIYYWLKKMTQFPEWNLLVRKKVLEECFPFSDSEIIDDDEAWLVFNYRFNVSGFLPYFVPIVANYCRSRDGIGKKELITAYFQKIERYTKKLVGGKVVHCYRNGAGELLPDNFSRSVFLFYDFGRYIKFGFLDLCRYIKSKLPNRCLLIIEKALFFWRAYRWGAFQVAFVRAWYRLVESLKRESKIGGGLWLRK